MMPSCNFSDIVDAQGQADVVGDCPADWDESSGNGSCEAEPGENCENNPEDCGACCGNGVCEPEFGESCAQCPEDCVSCFCGDGAIEPNEECDDGNELEWDGCTSCTITEFQVNTYTSGNQTKAAVAGLNDGGYVIVWESSPYPSGQPQDGAGGSVFAQRFDAEGNKVYH